MSAATSRGAPPLASAIRAIALNTFREAIRDRILYLLIVFALVLIAVSRLLSMLTVGDENKIVKDVGLSAVSVFGVLTAVFVGVSLVFKEIDRRTVYTLLANPVRRWQFIAGKFCGLFAVLAMNVGLMTLALSAVLFLRGESPWALLPAVALILVELAMVAAFALLFSSVTNAIMAALATFAIYVMGHLSWSLQLLQNRMPEGPARTLCDVFYFILPHLDRMNLKSEVVHGVALSAGTVGLAAFYGLAYTAVILLLACWAFERKEFQ